MLSGGGNCSEARDIVRKIELAAKFVKDVRTIRRKGDKSETEAICRHCERQRTPKGILPRTARYSPTMQARNPAYK